MKGILLDTNVLSELMRTEPDQAVMDWFSRRVGSVFYISAITQAEILLGIALLPAGKRRNNLEAAAEAMFRDDFAGRCLPFDDTCTARFAAIVSGRRRVGFQMTTEDAQIAAVALSHNFILATRNTKDFLHIDDLELQNPWRSE